ncbi:Two component transcriptional regulator, winged helix family [Sinomonas atrocyanea]|uniref:Transcriptional regulatory protein KdpE n=1 Tax=Sinomonas atrocyanea TaxID=37927 RepID=A0A127A4Q9_9MICC|nr:response regulator [Sinomonas atrocyanea]AMM33764.1 Two component transcriptional regulator, winged helix family [Sinomonas atrocyanea]GEB66602.1 putative transcriptional regulatory protein KdpE [Sinomonas atrocyanea]GGG70926.1 putative transcriptional regulatory protein KdpE [Sinomonas atrocyanea]
MSQAPQAPGRTTVLIVEDEARFARALQINLRVHGYEAVTAPTGEDALEIAAERSVDIVVLDLGLPGIDGIEVIRRLRGWTDLPIIVLSARHGSEDKVEALDAGADDYVTKPFGLEELLARLRAAARRGARSGEAPRLQTGDLSVDLAARRVVVRGADVRLTPTEWNILALLVRRAGQLVTQREILTQVWGPAYAKETQYLRVYLAQLRRKLEEDAAHPRHLHTEAGMGYRFDP